MADTNDKGNTSAILDSLKNQIDDPSGMTVKERDAALTNWLSNKAGQAADIIEVSSPSASGSSSEILLITLADQISFDSEMSVNQFALRLRPKYEVYPETSMERQYQCLGVAAHRTTAPVPAPLAFESDESILGAPFYITELCSGKSAPDVPSYINEGWIHDLSGESRCELWKSGIQSIVSLQQADISDGVIDKMVLSVNSDNPLQQALNWWRKYYEFVAEGGHYPILEEALSVLEKERPEYNHAPVLVWGDASLRNMLFDGLAPSALLDFEFAHLGLREFDVAFYALVDRVMAEGFQQSKRLSGFMDKKQNFDYYEALTGHKVENGDYYTLMASFYNTLAVTRNYQRVAKLGVISTEQLNYNPGMQILDKILSGKD